MMRLKVTELNFLKSEDWIYKLVNEIGDEVYILNSSIEIDKHILDSIDIGSEIIGEVESRGNRNIVTKLIRYT